MVEVRSIGSGPGEVGCWVTIGIAAQQHIAAQCRRDLCGRGQYRWLHTLVKVSPLEQNPRQVLWAIAHEEGIHQNYGRVGYLGEFNQFRDLAVTVPGIVLES